MEWGVDGERGVKEVREWEEAGEGQGRREKMGGIRGGEWVSGRNELESGEGMRR